MSPAPTAKYPRLNDEQQNAISPVGKEMSVRDIMTFPLNILFEIFSHLHPYDLLCLARLTKAFRKILMSQGKKVIWERSRQTVPNLPIPPPSMSEPAWANLLFDHHCHLCQRPNIQRVAWIWRIRICGKCSETAVAVDKSCGRNTIMTLLPLRARQYGCKMEFLKTHFDEVSKSYEAASIIGPEAVQVFVAKRRAIVADFTSLVPIGENWENGRREERCYLKADSRSERLSGILQRLIDLGWGEEIALMSPEHFEKLLQLRAVKQSRALTDRIWKACLDPLTEFMKKVQTERKHKAIESVKRANVNTAIEYLRCWKRSAVPWLSVFPEAVDFCNFPSVAALIDTPQRTLELSCFGKIAEQIHVDYACWVDSINCLLEFMLLEATPERSEILWGGRDPLSSGSFLHLATTIFLCRLCAALDCSPAPLFYPEVLNHACLTREQRNSVSPCDEGAPKDDSIPGFQRERTAWNGNELGLDLTAAKIAQKVVAEAGLDPEVATVQDMDTQGILFYCSACGIIPHHDLTTSAGCKVKARQVYGWRAAVLHNLVRHPEGLVQWIPETCVPPNGSKVAYCRADHWKCLHCIDLPQEEPAQQRVAIEIHLKRAHGITEPKCNKDFAALYGTPPLHSLAIVTIRVEDEFEEILYQKIDTLPMYTDKDLLPFAIDSGIDA